MSTGQWIWCIYTLSIKTSVFRPDIRTEIFAKNVHHFQYFLSNDFIFSFFFFFLLLLNHIIYVSEQFFCGSNELKPALKIRPWFQGHRWSGWNINDVVIYTLSGGVDNTLIYTKFGVDKFVHRRLKSMEKSRKPPVIWPHLRLSGEKAIIYNYFLR